LGLNKIQIFEIGNIFKESGEEVHLAIGVAANSKKLIAKEEEMSALILEIKNLFGVSLLDIKQSIKQFEKGIIVEINLNEIQASQKESVQYVELKNIQSLNTKYKSLSTFPFITRDISVLAGEDIDVKIIENILEENSTDLCTKIYQFDRFQKEGESKVAFGYRLVFQSFEKTLEDAAVSVIMDKIYEVLKEKGLEIR
jgi:phenylalanyl-tRNA synthetase beta subunit